jgi:chromosome segregation ATPase
MKLSACLLILSFMLLSCTSYEKENKHLKEEIKVFKEENDYLKAEIFGLKKELTEVSAKVKDERENMKKKLQEEREQMQKKLQEEREQMQKRLQEISKKKSSTVKKEQKETGLKNNQGRVSETKKQAPSTPQGISFPAPRTEDDSYR